MNPRRWLRHIDAFVAVAIALAVLPILVAVVRAIADGWIPLGDQALLQIRAHDVLTAHHPLLGTASSAALNRADVVPLNHPGPLMFDVLAVPVRLFGGGAGVAIGVGLINMAATAVGIVFAARRSGRACAALAALAFAGLGWAAGSESLYDPYNPTAAMLSCLACLFLAWCAVDLDGTALVWLIAVSTFAVQLNNSYLLFLTPLAIVVCAVFVVRALRQDSGKDRGGPRAAALRAAIVFAVLWSQPVLEQLLHSSDGNLARMVKASNVLGNIPGARLGTQIAASTLTLPPWWSRSEFDGVRLFSPVPGFALAAASLLLVVAACIAGCRLTWRNGHRDAASALLMAAISTAIGWVAAIRSPISSFFGVSSDYVRWLWPASVFIWFAAGLTVWRLLAPYLPAVLDHRKRFVGGAIAIAAFSLANLSAHASLRGQKELNAIRGPAGTLIDMASDRVDVATLLYRPPPNYDVFGVPLLARLQSEGTDFLVDDPVLVRQFGNRRRYSGEVVPELRVVTAVEALDVEVGPNTVAFVSDLPQDERIELQSLSIEIESWLPGGEITLSTTGHDAVDAGFGEPWLSQLGDPSIDATAVSRSNDLAASVRAGLLDGEPNIMTALDRFATLRQRVETSTVAVLLTPADEVASATTP